jgi:hypothetical protein
MQRLRISSDNFSTFKLSLLLPVFGSAFMVRFSLQQDGPGNNGSTVDGTVVTCPKFAGTSDAEMTASHAARRVCASRGGQ